MDQVRRQLLPNWSSEFYVVYNLWFSLKSGCINLSLSSLFRSAAGRMVLGAHNSLKGWPTLKAGERRGLSGRSLLAAACDHLHTGWSRTGRRAVRKLNFRLQSGKTNLRFEFQPPKGCASVDRPRLPNAEPNFEMSLSFSFTNYRCKRKMLPALFDWSIIGCTILRLALMNLKQQKIHP